MAFAFTHLLGAWIPGKIYERSKKISQLAWGLLLFGSILPDIDLLFQWVSGIPFHRTVTHSLLFAVIMGVVVYLTAVFWKMKKPAKLGFAISLGILIHIIIDCMIYPGTQLLWPYDIWFSLGGFYSPGPVLGGGGVFASIYYAIADMGLGVAWMGYMFLQKKLRF